MPADAKDVPCALEHQKDAAGNFFVVRWPRAVRFATGERKASLWFSVARYGTENGARQQAWKYLSDRYRALYRPVLDAAEEESGLVTKTRMRGPLSEADEDNRCFHGDRDHRFTVWSSFGKPFNRKFNIVVGCDE